MAREAISRNKFVSKEQRRGQSTHSEFTGAIPELPVLRWARTMGDSEFVDTFRPAIKAYALRHFGNLGKLIEDCKYYEPAVIVIPEVELEGIRGEMMKEMLKSRLRSRINEIEKMRNDRSSLYSTIYYQLSPLSIEKIKEYVPRARPVVANPPVRGDDELPLDPDGIEDRSYARFHADNDPRHLWEAVVATHTTAATGFTEMDKMEHRKEYARLSQRKDEPILEFKQRFNNLMEQRIIIGETAIPDVAQAVDFIDKVDNSRYGRLKETINNDRFRVGAPEYPATLEAAYQIVSKWKTMSNETGELGPPMGIFPVYPNPRSYGRNDRSEQQQVVKERSITPYQQRNGDNNKKSNGYKRYTKDLSNNNNSSSSNNYGHSESRSNKLKPKRGKCNYCNEEGHFYKDCPFYQCCQDFVANKKEGTNINKKGSMSLTIKDDTHNDPNNYWNILGSKDEDVGALVMALNNGNNIDHIGDNGIGLGKYDVILDSGAAASIMKEKDILYNIRAMDRPVTFQGS